MRKILVIGGGIGGLTAIIAFQQKGFDAHVYEATAQFEPVGRGIWMPPNAMQVFERLGISDSVTEYGVSLKCVELKDRYNGVLVAHDLPRVKAKFGHSIVSIHRARLHRILVEKIQPNTVHLDKRCIGFKPTTDKKIIAHFEDGTQAKGDVLIGADGIHSTIRKILFPEVKLRYSGLTCYRGISDIELPRSLIQTCWEVWGGDVRFGFSPIGQREVYWFAVIVAPEGKEELRGTLHDTVSLFCTHFPFPVLNIIEKTPEDDVIRTDLYDIPPVLRWSSDRVVLLGDAIHAMTPNTGQGGAQAIEDAFVLANQLSVCQEVSEAFREYERLRAPRVNKIVNRSRLYGRLVHIRPYWLQKIRDGLIKSAPEWLKRKKIDELYIW
ncbi:MAG: hypothetical protein GWN00_13915 [Aliifodinibius sp.]|nr:hypothetical protein [Fodinibius sp.]NIV12221.1 hypothetical protein [Fodinibius sp.]NIY25863.1 hypothetical protein [Fodinibius sp.]